MTKAIFDDYDDDAMEWINQMSKSIVLKRQRKNNKSEDKIAMPRVTFFECITLTKKNLFGLIETETKFELWKGHNETKRLSKIRFLNINATIELSV